MASSISQAVNPALTNGLNPAALAANPLTAASLPYGNPLGGTPTPFPALTASIGPSVVPPAITNGINNTSSPIPGF